MLRTLRLTILFFVLVLLAPCLPVLAQTPSDAGPLFAEAPGDELCPAPVTLGEHQQQPGEPKPVQLECLYTCSRGGQTWHLICSGSSSSCCGTAAAACPYLEPPSTGTASCSCSPTGI